MVRQLLTCSAFIPGGTVVCLNEHNEEDGVPAGPAQESTPDDERVEPAALLMQQECIWSYPGTYVDQLHIITHHCHYCLMCVFVLDTCVCSEQV